MENEKVEIPILDYIGNKIHIGSLVLLTPEEGQRWIGTVTEFTPSSGLSVVGGNKKPSPAQLRIVFDITLSIIPGMISLKPLLRLTNPESEMIMSRILDSQDTPTK